MPELVMLVGGEVFARQDIEYDGLVTAGQRMELQERVARALCREYAKDIFLYRRPVQFYIEGVKSKGNKMTITELTKKPAKQWVAKGTKMRSSAGI